MKFQIFLAFNLLSGLCFSQAISGKVVTQQGYPIPYAHIGIIGTQFGTISKVDGTFDLDVNGQDRKTKVSFSSIGYKRRHIPMAELLEMNTVILEEGVTILQQVNIEEKKLRKKDFVKAGRTKPTKTTIGHSGLIELGIGGEWAVEILPLEEPMKIVSVNFHLRWNSLDSVLYRIYFYDIRDGLPGDVLNKQEIFYTSQPGDKWLKKYVESSDLILDKPMAVSIEIVRKHFSENGQNFLFFSYANDPETRSFARDNSFGSWTTEAPFPLTLYLELEELPESE